MTGLRNWDNQVTWDASAAVRTESQYLTDTERTRRLGGARTVRSCAHLRAPRLTCRHRRSEFHDSFRFNAHTDRDPHWVDSAFSASLSPPRTDLLPACVFSPQSDWATASASTWRPTR